MITATVQISVQLPHALFDVLVVQWEKSAADVTFAEYLAAALHQWSGIDL